LRVRIGGLVTAAVVGLAGLFVQAAPASAYTIDLYENQNGGGGYAGRWSISSNYSGTAFNNGVALNDNVSSLKNREQNYTIFWTNSYCSGTGLDVPPQAVVTYVGDFNDRFSSHAPEWYLNGC
jgi:hypothetical protein